ncbi:MAG TPA: hypothetical protein VHE37_04330 [Nevskiaceae bacterium]|nr:hypothetical protein [Nevskiaceae bacterium]
MAALHQGFLSYRQFAFLKLAALLCVAGLFAYAAHDPPEGPSGGSWLGYTLGTLGALIIVWLAWLGVRKRRYARGIGSVKAWVSAHVYLGLSLLIIATLHTGFRFGWNVHTLSYLLMLAVIASGIYGVLAYARYPELITRNSGDAMLESWLAEIQDLNDQALKIADTLGPDVHARVLRSNERVRVGGSAWQQLIGRTRPRAAAAAEMLNQNLSERMQAARAPVSKPGLGDFASSSQSTVMFMADQLVAGLDEAPAKAPAKGNSEADRIRKLLDLLARRQELVARANRDITLTARMQVWLYLHVPLTFALLAALAAHIVSVFLYW